MKNKEGQPRHRHEDVPDGVLPHHGHINDNYGQRYPPGASAVESDYDRGVATQIETHRNYLKSQQETFGDTLPSIKDDPVQFLNNTLTELVHSSKKLYRLERAKIAIGPQLYHAIYCLRRQCGYSCKLRTCRTGLSTMASGCEFRYSRAQTNIHSADQ